MSWEGTENKFWNLRNLFIKENQKTNHLSSMDKVLKYMEMKLQNVNMREREFETRLTGKRWIHRMSQWSH